MATKHTHTVVFGRKVAGCPRCDELLAGAEPVRWNLSGDYCWQRRRFLTKAEALAKRLEEIRTHDCKASRCNPICCTAFDW